MIDFSSNQHPSPKDGLIKAYTSLFIFALALLITCLFSSCKTVRGSERRIVDSVVINRVDSVFYSYKDTLIIRESIKDSVRIKDSIVITKGEDGRILFREDFHWNDHNTLQDSSKEQIRDLTNMVMRLDSTMNSKSRTEETIIEAKIPWYQRLMIDTYPVILIALIIAGLLWYLRRKTYIA